MVCARANRYRCGFYPFPFFSPYAPWSFVLRRLLCHDFQIRGTEYWCLSTIIIILLRNSSTLLRATKIKFVRGMRSHRFGCGQIHHRNCAWRTLKFSGTLAVSFDPLNVGNQFKVVSDFKGTKFKWVVTKFGINNNDCFLFDWTIR